jgi:hypothetical protein
MRCAHPAPFPALSVFAELRPAFLSFEPARENHFISPCRNFAICALFLQTWQDLPRFATFLPLESLVFPNAGPNMRCSRSLRTSGIQGAFGKQLRPRPSEWSELLESAEPTRTLPLGKQKEKTRIAFDGHVPDGPGSSMTSSLTT